MALAVLPMGLHILSLVVVVWEAMVVSILMKSMELRYMMLEEGVYWEMVVVAAVV